MKAVYERPNVRFEMFGANDAVAACLANQGFTFECMSGQNKDYSAVLNNSLNLLPNDGDDTCDVEAGVAWMNTVTDAQLSEIYKSSVDEDDYNVITSDTVTVAGSGGTSFGTSVGSHTTTIQIDSFTGGHGQQGTVTASPYEGNENYTFMGWLYITGFSDKPQSAHDGWNTSGWSTDTGALSFSGSATPTYNTWGKTIHAMLAAIWNIGIRAS